MNDKIIRISFHNSPIPAHISLFCQSPLRNKESVSKFATISSTVVLRLLKANKYALSSRDE